MQGFIDALGDGVAVARRNIIKIIRVPEILVSVIVSPLMMVVMFAYVFGSAIDVPGGEYREFLIGGTFALTLTFGSVFTGAGLAEDMKKGIIDRFRSLPMSRAAVVFGRTASDVIYNVASLVIMAAAGWVVGWRINNGPVDALVGFALLLAFAYAFSWVMAYVGLLVPGPEVVNNASFIVIFPMTFIANTFVPAEGLPAPLRAFAEWNPVSAVTQAARELFGNIPPGTPEPSVWPLENAALYATFWIVGLIAVFAPLAIRRFNQTGRTS